MFVFIIAAAALLILFIVWRTRVRQWAPVVEKEPYILQPETPSAIGDLDPRAEVDEHYDDGPDTLDTPATSEAAEKSFAFWLGRSGTSEEDGSNSDEPADDAGASQPDNAIETPGKSA